MTRILLRRAVAVAGLCVALGPSHALAQPSASAAPAPIVVPSQAAAEPSRWWITIGGGSTTLKAYCGTCTGDPVYNHAGNILANVGFRGNRRMDGGVEVLWVPAETPAGDAVRTTMVLGVAQFRPWEERGFFLKAGMGIAFVRNWVYDALNDVTPPYITNAMALTYGAGWEFKTGRRVGFQVLGTHHIIALGDFTNTDGTTVENVLGNFWSIGGGIVIR